MWIKIARLSTLKIKGSKFSTEFRLRCVMLRGKEHSESVCPVPLCPIRTMKARSWFHVEERRPKKKKN